MLSSTNFFKIFNWALIPTVYALFQMNFLDSSQASTIHKEVPKRKQYCIFSERKCVKDIKMYGPNIVSISLTGEIINSDPIALKLLFKKERKSNPNVQFVISLNSLGGHLVSALKLSDVINSKGNVTTFVENNSQCLSACALIFLAGAKKNDKGIVLPSRVIEKGGQVGFHAVKVRGAPKNKFPTSHNGDGVSRDFQLEYEYNFLNNIHIYLNRWNVPYEELIDVLSPISKYRDKNLYYIDSELRAKKLKIMLIAPRN